MPNEDFEWPTEEEILERKVNRLTKTQSLLEKAECAPPGKRGLNLKIGDKVRFYHTLYRQTRSPGGTDDTLRVWTRKHREEREGYVVGARTLHSGALAQAPTNPLTQAGGYTYLEIWRTHRIYIVTEGLWKSHKKVLSNDLERKD